MEVQIVSSQPAVLSEKSRSGKAVFGGADVGNDLCFSLWGVNSACVHLESIWSKKSTQAVSQMLTGFFFESWLFNVKSWSCPWLSVNQQEFKTRHLVILLDLLKSQGIFKLTGVQYHSQCEGIELCSCNHRDFRGYHCWTLIIYLNVKSGGADKRTCWSKWHGSFCLILVLVLRRQLNRNNSKGTETLGVTAGFMYREEIEFFCCVLVSQIKTGQNSSFLVRWYFHTSRTASVSSAFPCLMDRTAEGKWENIGNADVTKLDFAHFYPETLLWHPAKFLNSV